MPCNCKAYKFPHRFGGGECKAVQDEPICSECLEPCQPVQCDDGIGWNEFWGSVAFDSRPYIGSSCCSAECLDPETGKEWIHD